MEPVDQTFDCNPPLDDVDLGRLEAIASEVELDAGQLLTERGHAGAGMYLVLEGSVLVEAPERTHLLGPGTCIGERALLSPRGKRTARVRAWTNVRALAVARSDFELLGLYDPGLAPRLAAAAR
jgi:CRP-like cAMP-binding protein